MSIRAILEFSIILLLVIESSSAESTMIKVLFGDFCGLNDIKCDSRSLLTCVENKCQCIKPMEMTFDKNQGKCLVLSGKQCIGTAGKDFVGQKWAEKLDCVENAKCNNNGFCSCLQEYYDDAEGFCVPKHMHGLACSSIQKCREDKYLMCADGICICNKTITIFDSDRNECVFKAGQSCSHTKPCVQNAYCLDDGSVGGLGYDNSRCTCREHYKVSKNGRCLAQYNMECNSKTAPCLEDLACINGQCSCPFPGHQTYKNDGSNKCLSLLRGPCKDNTTKNILHFSCVSGAECRKDDKTGIYECQCSKGHIESGSRTCAIEYGQECETTKGKNPCDTIANLICINGKCVCPDFQVYNSGTYKCQGLDGEKCNLETAEVDQFCINGAHCRRYRDDKLGEGVCRCVSPDWVADFNRKCVFHGSNSKSNVSTI